MNNLICHQLFRQKIFPRLHKVVSATNYTLLYTILYNELVILNLLEVVLFHKEAFMDDSECFMDLVDYCVDAVTKLEPFFPAVPSIEAAKAIDVRSSFSELEKQIEEMRFSMGITALSILRYVTDYLKQLPLSVIHRVLETHDLICLMVNTMETHPWLARPPGKNEMQVYEDGAWYPAEAERLTKVEAQVWLSLYNLLVEPEFRKKYEYSDYRQRTVLKVNCLL